MWERIFGIGGFFFLILLAFLYYLEHTDLTSLLQIGSLPVGANRGLSPYELSLFFTTFVMLQFWNMFNARAFQTGQSAFHLKGCKGFLYISTVIFFGQILIVSTGGEFFSVVPISICDWLIIIFSTSLILFIGEFFRLYTSRQTR